MRLSRLRGCAELAVLALSLSCATTAAQAPTAIKTSYEARLSDRGPDLIFKVSLDEDAIPTSIAVYRMGEATPIQTLPNRCQSSKEVFPVERYPSLDLVRVVDLNFDGYGDLELVAVANSAHLGNTFYCCWLWDQTSQQFRPLTELDEVADPMPDPQTRTITSRRFYMGGPELEEIYAWIDGKLVLSESRRLYYGSSVPGCNEYVVDKRESEQMVTVRDELVEPGLQGIEPCHVQGEHRSPVQQ